ncbi:MAG TPA: hypothetical protein VFF73_15735, partial [Planctomycetota bacterium]|nr:hypothetical protein [Planctomycetota bacterium]
LLPALEAAAEVAALDPSTRVVVASDLDRPALAGVERRSEAARRLRLEVIDADDEPRNAYLGDVTVSPSPALQGEAVTVSGRVLEVGLGGEAVPVALEIDGREIARESVTPGALARFTIPAARAPLVQGALVAHAHGDALAADDRAAFVAPVLARISVALLGREEAPDGGENREQPLLDALAAVGRARDVPIGVRVVTEPTLAAALEDANVLVLASPDELRARARDQIARFVEGGHGLIIIVDEDAPRETLRDLAARGVIPATARPLEAGPRARLDARGLDATLGRAFSALALVPQAGLQGGEPLVTAGGEPLWVERGKVVMLGFAPWGRNAGLASQTAFPLVAFRALRAALGALGAPRPEVGATLGLADLARASSISTRALGRATLVLPDGTTRSLAGEDVLRVSQPGVHVIRDRDEVLAAFAARPSERESRLERASPGERAALASAPAPEAPRERGDLDLTLYVVLAGSLLLALACFAESR